MKWIRERDALIAQTLAFVQSVTGRKEDLSAAEGPLVAPAPSPASTSSATLEYVIEALQPESPPAGPDPAHATKLTHPKVSRDVEAEMRDRIASFRKHQERFRREREEYCSATLAKVRAALREAPPLRPEK